MKIFLIMVVMMTLAMASFAIALTTETETTAASVTVNTFVSTTISTCGATAFGSKDPSTTNNPVTCQSTDVLTTPAVSISIDSVTNVNVDLALKGTAFTHTDNTTTFAVTNADFDDDCNVLGLCGGAPEGLAKATLSTSFVKYFLDKAAGSANKLWFFLDVPSSQKAGAYSSTFSFKTVEQGQAL